MPGHHLTLELAGDSPRLTIKQYWDVPETGPVAERDDASWIAELRQRLEETVRMRLMSDVPLGVFLSGGIDSSLIAALMRGMVADKIKTFSVGYAEAPYSELGYAAQVARSLDTDHHEVRVSMDDFFGALPRLIWHEDEPIAWPSSVSLYFVSKLAAREVKVVLTGEGSDELFAGYGRYGYTLRNERHMAAWRVAPAWLRDSVRRGIQTTPLLSAELRRKIGHTALGREDSIASLLLDNFYGPFSKDQRARLHSEPEGAAYQNYLRYYDARPHASRLSRMLYADQKTYLVELLMKQDQMSMAASIESRVPLPRSHFSRVRRYRSRSPQDPQRHRQVHFEESRRRPPTRRNHSSQENGFPHADEAMAEGPARGTLLHSSARSQPLARGPSGYR